ncbi:MAG: hypothetical protein QXR45_08700 [Candidatus Bathyarchaeia archaeon]
MEKRRPLIIAALWIWWIVGIITIAACYAIFQPWGPKLGMAESPERIYLYYVYVLGHEVPASLVCLYYWSKHQEWLAPPGRYISTKKYKMINPWVLTGGAVMAALYGVFALVGSAVPVPGGTLDLAATATAVMMTYFGAVTSGIAVLLGAIIRFLLTGRLPGLPLMWPAFALADSYRWITNSYVYWRLVRVKREKPLKTWIYWGLLIPFIIANHRLSIFMQHTWRYPLETLAAVWLGSMIPALPFGILAILVGVIVGETLYRMSSLKPTKVAVQK